MNIDRYENIAYDQYLPDLVCGRPVPRFGTFLRQLCERAGITQPLLEKKGQAKYQQMERDGYIVGETNQSSMLQQAISKVATGQQQPSYLQVYIWSKAIEEHYNNELVVEYFKKKGLEVPVFTPEIKTALWALSGYQPPDAIKEAIDAVANFNHVPRRLPRGMGITPQTDAHIKSTPRHEEPHTGPLDARAVREH
jgi:transcriptional regulator with XRE-family HTH domain